ncbi:TPA: hypothetical protein ACRMYO_006182 [Pseudomonas aeruginosa]|uniref:hypothetical protein n=1 Tax=Pseudomonas aeruginosa TaxID=287 RepID=UPI0008727C02|nr:hypothetical protein [Pseudomonas aeruginosa]ELP9629057.1 hypothetical protein [Pseudomonas aeruginosa]ELQ6364648.1 hypothetical protein [Pseudomonas aeruginosa]OFC31408.1 hypothetical protein AN464_27665 [Pseudomonas aeruginosa]HCR1319793.1 hypothetical protein [Pseudomonas aeruginosa]HCR1374045.1 hypothetical protein [Pseudomonas aeruginosa]
MKPFRVTIQLAGPMIVPKHPIHLDGLLAALHVQALEEAGHPSPWDEQHNLPLERYVTQSGEWVFKASMLLGVPIVEPHLYMITSRTDATRVAEDIEAGLLKCRQARLNSSTGPFKSGIQNLNTTWVKELCADGIGNLPAIDKLLQNLEFVGPRRGLGMGRVAAVSIEETAEARWMNRHLPLDADIDNSTSLIPQFGALRPPYWEKTAMTVISSPMI